MFEHSVAYRPFKYGWAMELAAVHEKMHWIEDEAEVGRDVEVWRGELSEGEKNIITHVMRLFTQSDVAVGQLYIENLLPEFKNNEIRAMLLSFAAREGIHQRAYALVSDTLGLPDTEWSVFLELKEMKDKWEFMTDTSENGILYKLAKQLMLEGVSLFGLFAVLFQFRLSGKMLGMSEIVEWSIRDESMHCEGLSALFLEAVSKSPELSDQFKKSIYDLVRSLVELEVAYLKAAYNYGKLQHLSLEEAIQFIQFMADFRLSQIGFKPIYNVANPCEWLTYLVNARTLKNFFEGRVTAYSKGSLTGEWEDGYNATFG